MTFVCRDFNQSVFKHFPLWKVTVGSPWVQLASHRCEGDLQPGKHPLDIHALKMVSWRKAKAAILTLHEEKLLCPALE